MPVNYSDLLSDDVWEPLELSAADPSFYWNDGGFMRAAPVDVPATFAGAIWSSDRIDPWFQMRPRKVKPDFTIPLRHHNFRQLMIVIDGDIDVAYGPGEGTQHVSTNEFWVCEAGTAYAMTTGPKGATYIECWDGPMALVETYWHDDKSWVRK